ncbi:MAG: tripartite tricarboxylate transporter substrate binding protein [Betaproteobacteria bacterium]|nr:tripartite tricarboxylate transporter substrate binding protein [Betaproteobacteria bacterium]
MNARAFILPAALTVPRRLAVICVQACLSVVLIGVGHAQSYPAKPVRLIVPFPPGGGVDGVARIAFQKMSESMQQQFVIDNRGGSGGIIAAQTAVRAAADGYTLFFGTTATQAITPHYYKNLAYDPIRDFAPINLIGGAGYILVVHPSVQAATVQAFIALAKAKPRALNYSSSGNGTVLHLTTELFCSMAGIQMTHVPYKGAGPALADFLSGQVQATANPASVVLPHIQAGRLRALGVTSAKRTPLAPELPTIAEAGVPGYEASGWYAVLAPTGTPPAIITRLNRELNNMVADREVRERFFATGVEPIGGTPQQFAAYQREEYTKWGKVMRLAGVRVE